MRVKMKPLVFRTIVCFCVVLLLSPCHAFDLISAILSQTPSLPGRLPVSLQELRSMLTPEIIQKMLQSKLPSLDSLRGDPAQIQKVLAKLKPMQGRFDPQILELLSNNFQSPQPTYPPSTMPATYQDSEEGDHSVKRGIVPPFSHRYPPRRPGPNRSGPKFSSRFRHRLQGNDERETTMVMLNPSTDNTEAPPPFDHITDPNIRNHRLYGWQYQNFTEIDREEDLMMDESSSPLPAMIPLSSASDEVSGTTPVHDRSAEENLHVPDENTSRDPEDEASFPFTPRPREPLRKSSAENEPIEMHSGPGNPDPYFRPSPMDVSPPKSFEPGQEFYTTTIQSPYDEGLNMPKFPPKVRKKVQHGYGQGQLPLHVKQDRILSNGNSGQGYQTAQRPQQQVYGHGPNMGSQRIMHRGPGSFGGQNVHPFANIYTERNEMYSPSLYHHNKYHYHNPTLEKDKVEGQSPATDKYDSSWTPTFVLLGGLVAASALVAFILPSFLTTMTTVGKDNDEPASSDNTDVWTDIKGLYSDLTHIAKGDLSHFNKETDTRQDNEEETKSSTSRISVDMDTDSPDEAQVSEEQDGIPQSFVNSRGRGRGRHNETLASPVHPSITFSNSTLVQGSRYRKANSTFLKEWAKVQLQLIDNN